MPKVVLVLIIAKCLEDALHGFIADGLLGLFVDGLPGHADSHSFWGGCHQPFLQPHGRLGYSLPLALCDLRWAPTLLR